MSTHAGALLWRRAKIKFPANALSVAVDTGLRQVGQGFGEDPQMAERLMVIPLPPIDVWLGISLGEPAINANGTIELKFTTAAPFPEPRFLNVLFWVPHTLVGPGQADPYNAPPLIEALPSTADDTKNNLLNLIR